MGRRYFLEDSSTVTVRGVVKDFYDRSVGHTIEPLVFRSRPTAFREALIRISPMAQEGIEHRLLAAWRSVYPDHPMETSWLDDKITEM